MNEIEPVTRLGSSPRPAAVAGAAERLASAIDSDEDTLTQSMISYRPSSHASLDVVAAAWSVLAVAGLVPRLLGRRLTV